MRTTTLSLLSVAMLAACASPVRGMHPAQIAGLNDYQLCNLSVSYRYEPQTEAEIARRGLVCTPETLTCMGQGVAQGSAIMPLCAANARAQSFAETMAYQDSARRDYAVYEHGDNANAQHLFIWK